MVTDKDIIRITLPEDLVREAAYIGEQIAIQKEAKYGTTSYTKGSTIPTNVRGKVSEAGVAFYFGVPWDKRILDRGDDGFDLKLGFPYWTTQNKSTPYFVEPWLRAEVRADKPNIKSYMLTCLAMENLNDLWIVGWLPRTDVLLLDKGKCLDDGPLNYIGKMKDLLPIVRHHDASIQF